MPRSNLASRRRLARVVPFAAALADLVAVLVTAGLVSIGHAGLPTPSNDVMFGGLIALAFVSVNVVRQNYLLPTYLRGTGQMRRALRAWCLAMVAAIAVAFLTKTGGVFSRGMAVLVFAAGSFAMPLLRLSLSRMLIGLVETGRLVARSVFVVGDEASVRAFTSRPDSTGPGLRVSGAAVIRPDPDHRADDLALAAASARVLRPDDVLIVTPWSDAALIGQCIDTFTSLPAAVHLGPDAILETFRDLHVVRNGPLTCVRVLNQPLSPLQTAVKRVFDLVVACVLMVVLSPFFVMIALLIRLDSKGPSFFRQTRYGYNQEPFRIVKFRTMSVLEDGTVVRQATRDDRRITRLGRHLRRTNLDELPQLLNVIRGEMSLVGPRPHAIAHDHSFAGGIASYARRYNVRPGITGWAQVNGWRGETETPDKMAGRIALDLYYVDNCSIWLDGLILARTLLSPRAYMNAR